MDPTETLRQLRELCKKAQTTYYGECTEITQELDRIVELFDSLDYWLSNGGFIPGQWRPEGRLIRMD